MKTCCCKNCVPAPNCYKNMLDAALRLPGVMSFICRDFKHTDKCLDASCEVCIKKHLLQRITKEGE